LDDEVLNRVSAVGKAAKYDVNHASAVTPKRITGIVPDNEVVYTVAIHITSGSNNMDAAIEADTK